jgi:hypothetical protein
MTLRIEDYGLIGDCKTVFGRARRLDRLVVLASLRFGGEDKPDGRRMRPEPPL